MLRLYLKKHMAHERCKPWSVEQWVEFMGLPWGLLVMWSFQRIAWSRSLLCESITWCCMAFFYWQCLSMATPTIIYPFDWVFDLDDINGYPALLASGSRTWNLSTKSCFVFPPPKVVEKKSPNKWHFALLRIYVAVRSSTSCWITFGQVRPKKSNWRMQAKNWWNSPKTTKNLCSSRSSLRRMLDGTLGGAQNFTVRALTPMWYYRFWYLRFPPKTVVSRPFW